ncbi:MAG TPA: isocitrate/isopropylmalate family dehydrogenase [Longimicrobiales bacterium]|nr:isocitrate/isopropylmalate family dehydrogenase [Longimicrobiales bacterium]
MTKVVTLIPGDGIGPDITDATVKVIEAAGVKLEWDRQFAGVAAVDRYHTPIPEETLASIRRTRVALKGPLTTPVGTGFRSVNVALRKEFDLYANVRPAVTLIPGGRYEDIDLVLIRENTEGLYVGVEHFIGVGDDARAAAESVMIITRFGAERVVRYAFDYAVKHGRKKVTLAHKANILKFTQGLFLEAGQKVAAEYQGKVAFDEKIIDNAAMQLVLNPYQFDVLVMENMFGDILSDLMAGLVGGLGLAPGANIGRDAAIFEPVHGSAPDIAGKGVANPGAMLLAACMMLDHIGEAAAAERVRSALRDMMAKKTALTPDLGGNASTAQFADALVKRLG